MTRFILAMLDASHNVFAPPEMLDGATRVIKDFATSLPAPCFNAL
jgi:hypothetical protein